MSLFSRVSLSLCALLGLPLWALAGSAPNIVYILADDLGYGDVKCFNPQGKIPTPHIDQLAAEGMRFTDAHSGSAVCSPTRYGLLTGRYAWRSRLQAGVLRPYDRTLISADQLTVPAFLGKHGYRTACIGKWHLGWEWPRVKDEPVFDQPIPGGPTARGFEYYFGTDVPNYPPYCFLENDRTIGIPSVPKPKSMYGNPGIMIPGWKLEPILPTLGAKAADYIAKRAAARERFFLYLPLTSPHTPIAVAKEWQGKSGLNAYADFVMETDWVVGQVLAAIKKAGLGDNTLVLFTSDNGCSTAADYPALLRKGHNPSGPYRGTKADIWEGGHRVPFIVRWPGVVQPGTTCQATICHTNLLATCAQILQAKLPAEAGPDSFSILPLLRGEKTDTASPHGTVHHSSTGMFAIRKGPWKLILGRGSGGWTKGGLDDERGQLYNLSDDPSESKNLYARQPTITTELTALLARYVTDGRSTPGPKLKNDRPINWDRTVAPQKPGTGSK